MAELTFGVGVVPNHEPRVGCARNGDRNGTFGMYQLPVIGALRVFDKPYMPDARPLKEEREDAHGDASTPKGGRSR